MNQHHSPGWLREHDLQRSVQAAREMNTPESSIVDTIADTMFTDVPRQRVEAIVQAVPEKEESDGSNLPLSQAPATDYTPRTKPPRHPSIHELSYLSHREFGRVLGLVLEQFDGNTVRPSANSDVEVDLYWNRQHSTVAIRTVPSSGDKLSEAEVDALVTGDVDSDITRAPSELCVATNGAFSEAARDAAACEDITLLDGGQLAALLRRTVLPWEAVGTVLETAEDHQGALTELVDVDEVPHPRQDIDPLEITPVADVETDEIGHSPDGRPKADRQRDDSATGKSGTPTPDRSALDEPDAVPGETGTLYADSSEDGDYEAFDDYIDSIGE